MRILHVVSGDLWAGAEVQVFNLASALARIPGVSVQVVVLNPGILADRLQQAGIIVTQLNEKKQNFFSILSGIISLCRQWKPDVIHSHRHKENVLASLAAIIFGIASLRTVHGASEHAFNVWQLHKRFYHGIDQICGNQIQQAVVAVSTDLGQKLLSTFKQQQIAIIENGIDSDTVIQQAHTTIDFHVPEKFFLVAFIGRLVAVKRVDLFIQMARKLSDELPGVYKFYIFGDGPQRLHARQLCDKLGLTDILNFMGFQPLITTYLSRMHALVMTSDHEGLPMTVLEAMSLGVPVIAHAVGGIPVTLGHEHPAQLVENHTPEGYASAVRQLHDSQALCDSIRQAQAVRVRQFYSATRLAHDYYSLYLGLTRDSGIPEAYRL